ncbi:MAG: hypothetical protein WCL39_01810 [Armatimonadota bacterium]
MSVDTINLEGMSADELAVLIQKARELKAKKSTPSIKISGYVASVGKHVNATLEAVKKLSLSDGIPPRKWEELENQLKRLQLDCYRQEAEKVKITPRAARGGRRKVAK